MGVVYLARQVPLNRPVALKLLLGGERAGPKELIRFLAEAEAAAAVRHPHIVQVHEYGDHAGAPYLALEYLPGGSLADRLKANGPLEARKAAELIQKLARAAHAAHEQGIVHRDLKPSNVLFDADGEPRVTDFGLAKRSAADLTRTQVVMGTPAYMAPEQVQGRGKFATPETDVWALGVMLYECLTGTRPFESPDSHALVKQIVEHDPAPPRHPSNRIPRDLATICLKCLRKAPERRYRTAASLTDDLGAFLAGRSISARRPSIGERAARWSRRHPRLSTGLTVGLIALLLLLGPATFIAIRSEQLAARRQELARSEAILAQQKALRELKTAQVLLSSRTMDPVLIREGFDRGQVILKDYGVETEAGWTNQPRFILLSADQQRALRRELGGVLLMFARVELARKPDADKAAAEAALKWNLLAEECFAADDRPQMLAKQRAKLLELLPGTALPLEKPAAVPIDVVYEGYELTVSDKAAEALEKLVPFTEEFPDHFLAWFLRGACHYSLRQYANAAEAFTACTTLWPDFAWAHANRGIARYQLGKLALAEADLTHALQSRPDLVEVLVNRAMVREVQKNYAGAEADLSAALALPGVPTRVYFERSRVRSANGNKAGAEADAAEGLKCEPQDAVSWTIRGVWKQKADPKGAIADYDAAIVLNPKAHSAMRNKAVVLADFLNRPADAVVVMDKLLELYPYYTEARSGRAIYLARMGEAKRAIEDAAIVLKEEPSPYRLYQMAGLYAQLSKTDKTGAARQQALQYAAKAFRTGFVQFSLIAEDPDIDPIRDDPEFKGIVQHAKARFQTGK
jgi:tetratricopeptide (TPR) repeat protein